ncbi:Helicase conserved C-terminal domain/PLD-like domain/SNF2 family N-terminal domain [Geoglobus ahangari]|uniref:Helicase conserved C-terminal domain/PLD-like domain/SNF2 family N-terminal domain n=1 Tax=Geoglobus ahangari TaxID=113653 RepID=A0A0F7IDT4_9EURY|nr:helicase-related protein [Geoglobus ahangari]AKG91652.1 Helicase conserved C-terminal domain/PLD-like domain/SNF2 family N-terminal domain [Geoglobus ahangari]
MSGYDSTKIIDNTPGKLLKDVIKDRLKNCKEAKFAVGYFFLSGFDLVDEDFPKDVDRRPFLKLIMGNETTLPTKEELVSGYSLRELFKQKMIEELQSKELTEQQINQLKRLRDYIANNLIEVKLFDKSRLHAKLYLFLKDLEDKYGSPGVAIVGSSNFTAEGLIQNKELNVILTEREDVLYLNNWFDELWEEAIDFNEDLIRVIEVSGAIPGLKYPKIGKYLDPETLFKYLVYKWTEGRVLNLTKKDILLEFQLVGVMNAIPILNHYDGVILADSVGLGKSFMASAIIQEFLVGKYPHWKPSDKEYPAVMLILPPSLISQWEDLLVGRADERMMEKLERGELVRVNSEYFLQNMFKKLVKGSYNHKIYEIYDESGTKLIGKIAFLSLGLFQRYKADLKKGEIDEELLKMREEYDLFVIDEAHKYRNKNTNRWKAVRALQKKSNGFSNKFLLLTATPLNNTIDDLYNLIRLFTDDTFQSFQNNKYSVSVPDLIREYKKLKKEYEKTDDEGIKKKLKEKAAEIKRKVLDEVMILRTRKYITEQFRGLNIVFKDPKPYSIDYSPFYTPKFNELVRKISRNIDRINFEHTKLYGVRYIVFADDEEEEYKIIEISDLFKLLLGKRLESGVFPFETTLRKIYEKEKVFYTLFKKSVERITSLDDLRNLIVKAVEEAKINKELEDVAEEFEAEAQEEESWFDKVVKLLVEYVENYNLEGYSGVEKVKVGLKIALHNMEQDLKLMDEIFDALDALKVGENGDFKVLGTVPKDEDEIIDTRIYVYENDPKLEALKQLMVKPKYMSEKLGIEENLYKKKFIIFTQYKDTAYYLYHNLREWIEREIDLHPWLKDKADRIKIGLVTGDTDTETKMNYIKRFAPKANSGDEEVRRYGEIEILISTDALSEGVNLQDADAVVNFDLPWNPMIIVQRVGRVNRIGNDKDVYVLNFTPSREIEIIVGILSKLKQKIEDITLVVGKESKILSQEEDISVETFGERIKSLSELSMTDLEEFGISDEFKDVVEGGIPQEQVDEYKLWNIIQYELGYTDKDFEEVKNLGDGPYYTYIQSGNGKIFSIYEFYRGDFRIDRKIISIGKEGIKQESPLALLELVRGRKITPFKLDESAEKLKEIDKQAEKVVEKLKRDYQPDQKGFLYGLYNALISEKEKGRGLENYKSVVNTLKLLDYRQYSSPIKSLLVENKLIEVDKNNNVKILNLKGVVDTLYSRFLQWNLSRVPSLKVEKKHIGWFYAQ